MTGVQTCALPIYLDLKDGKDRFALLDQMKVFEPNLPIIIITGNTAIEIAVAAMQRGAADYVTKCQNAAELDFRISRAIQNVQLERDLRLLKRQLPVRPGKMLGDSPAMHDLWRQIEAAAPGRTPVLITGETGTGKELVIHTLHEEGRKRSALVETHSRKKTTLPLAIYHCAANPGTDLRATLFGTEAGRYTDVGTMPGLLEEVGDGWVVLDEFTEVPLDLQAQLLRVVEYRTYCRSGTNVERRFEGRVLAVTNRNPQQAIQEGRLKADLYYRLCGSEIVVPPLRVRREDIPLLARHFLVQACAECGLVLPTLSSQDMARLCAYDWPGNVRQLQQIMSQFARTGHLMLERDMQDEAGSHDLAGLPYRHAKEIVLRRFQERYVLPVLAAHGNNRAAAAKAMGVTRQGLDEILKQIARQLDTTAENDRADDADSHASVD